ncbi:CGP-CTERM sorting domain-containing protein [Thermococcus sp. M36]|uniref:CGP-CTERM sorting domain-containing protein n=1 Tax=Thermococcus sp. M36 TaxID=1638261 RepID=UPI00143A0902|nr:CGP-CTERM sorting domain-containing protein [Thermococcus sp. M36]NJE05890.1 CGP-CTERM sorting domain-containing protein [Thermococcus sp. M36]
MRKRALFLIFVLFASSSFASAVSVWEGLIDKPIYYVNIEGYSLTGVPPWNPFNDSSITWINIGYEYNETYTFNKYYEGGKWKEGFFLKHGNPKPFNITDWNLSKVLKEYQWGVVNYLPNITGKFPAGEWKKGYWNSSISRWSAVITSNQVKITLNTFACEGSGECDEYITFKCHRNDDNVTCTWGKPVFKMYPGRPPIGTPPQTTEKNKICGPALLVGLVLVPLLIKQKKR